MLRYLHEKYAARSNADLNRRARAKEEELRVISKKFSFPKFDHTPRVIVLGCPDSRMIKSYKKTFKKFFEREVDLTIIDIVTRHLKEKGRIIKHDATKPLPNSPYDVVYGHVLLKFIKPKKQWNVLENSYSALSKKGFAIHIFDEEEVIAKTKNLPDGWFSVPLKKLEKRLTKNNIRFKEISFNIQGIVKGITKGSVRGIKGRALVLFR